MFKRFGFHESVVKAWARREAQKVFRQPRDAFKTNIADLKHGELLFRIGGDRQSKIFGLPQDDTDPIRLRGNAYLRFFNRLLATHSLPRIEFLFNVDDLAEPRHDKIVFSFQRRINDPIALLPDVEMIDHTYEDTDSIPFDSKLSKAIFIGSTTGVKVLTHEVIDAGLNDRLVFAEKTKSNKIIYFRLPNIVQCQDGSVHNRLIDLGHGGDWVPWQDQLQHKVILSIDGNGAACSRVYRTLRSNSVLMKHKSPYELYYFRALQNGKHFIEFDCIEDLNEKLDCIESKRFRRCAVEGRRFADRYLNEKTITFYTHSLLQLFFEYSQRK